MNETIARLTGVLGFQVDLSGLRRFQQQLQTVSRQMQHLGAQATKLQSQLNLKAKLTTTGNGGFAAMSRKADELQKKLQMSLGVKNTDTTTAKASAELERSQAKQLRREVLLQRARKATFAAELQQSKLVSAGKREDASLATAQVRHQQQLAVLESKKAAAQQASLKAQGVSQRNQQSLLAAKARQTRLEQLVQQTAIKTQTLQARHTQTLTGVQKAELALQQARERGQQAQQRFQANQAAAKLRESRQEVSAQQRASRFSMSQDRHAAWQANQARRESEPSTGFMGLGTGALALGGATAAIAAVVAGLGALQARIEQRQKAVEGAEQFNNVFKSISPDEKVQVEARDRFIKSQQLSAGVIDTETAKDFRIIASTMLSAGKNFDQVISVWETRQQAFAIAGTTKEDNKSLNVQLNQLASDNTGSKADADIINNRMPMIVPYVVKEYMKEHKIKDFEKGMSAFNKDLKGGGGIKGEWYDEAFKNLVREHQADLERNRNSVTNAQTQADNTAFLQDAVRNTNAELSDALKDRIKSETELAAAMAPLRDSAVAVDIALNKLAASFLRYVFGKGDTAEESALKVETLSPDKPAIDPNGFGGSTDAPEGTPKPTDPIDALYRRLFGREAPVKPQEDNKSLGNIPDLPLFPGMQAPLNTDNLDKHSHPDWGVLSNLPAFNPLAMQNLRGVMDSSTRYTAENMFREAERRGKTGTQVSPDGSPLPAQAPVTNIDNSTHVAPATVNITNNITAPATADTEELGRLINGQMREGVRDEMQKVFTSYLPKEIK